MKTKKSLTEKISIRDKFRTGKNYYVSLRGYQVRGDILDSIAQSMDTSSFSKQKKIVILDIGCGPGIVGDYVYNYAINKYSIHPLVVFADISETMLKAISKNLDYINVKNDVTKLEFPDNFFDVIVMKQVLDYLPKNLQLRALNEIYRVLKIGGQFIFSALISPNDHSNVLANKLYNEREKIIAKTIKIQKYIPTQNILLEWLHHLDFKNIKDKYVYDIPLTAIDFQQSFGLDRQQTRKLNKLYLNIIKKDKENSFRQKEINGYVELVEKGIVIKCNK